MDRMKIRISTLLPALAGILVGCLFLSGLALAAVTPGAGLPDQAIGTLDQHNPEIQAVMAVQDQYTGFLMSQQGVVGTATGLGPDGRPAVLVLIESFAGARGATIPESLNGTPVAVRIVGELKSLAPGGVHGPPGGGSDGGGGCSVDRTARFDRPVPIGVSTGHPAITAGTIGARVTDGFNVYALSNNHVYANENSASINDNVLQPGTYDGGQNPADAIGTLDNFVPIVFSTGANNTVDAAIALTTTGQVGKATPCDGYGTPKSTTAEAFINQKVKKYGRTTGQTTGQIAGINATVTINYGPAGTARFVNQLLIQPGSFSAGGDSGSLIVVDGKGKNKSQDRNPVGLLFAGSTLVTIANPIDPVLDAFGVTIDGN